MNVALAADHAGLPLREIAAKAVLAAGHEPVRVGPDSGEPVDYPDVARELASALLDGRAERGILVCGSGAGATIAANKIRGIRAALAHDHYTAHQMVEHDDVNVLTMGGEGARRGAGEGDRARLPRGPVHRRGASRAATREGAEARGGGAVGLDRSRVRSGWSVGDPRASVTAVTQVRPSTR